jgi:hypothetical protein
MENRELLKIGVFYTALDVRKQLMSLTTTIKNWIKTKWLTAIWRSIFLHLTMATIFSVKIKKHATE